MFSNFVNKSKCITRKRYTQALVIVRVNTELSINVYTQL